MISFFFLNLFISRKRNILNKNFKKTGIEKLFVCIGKKNVGVQRDLSSFEKIITVLNLNMRIYFQLIC